MNNENNIDGSLDPIGAQANALGKKNMSKSLWWFSKALPVCPCRCLYPHHFPISTSTSVDQGACMISAVQYRNQTRTREREAPVTGASVSLQECPAARRLQPTNPHKLTRPPPLAPSRRKPTLPVIDDHLPHLHLPRSRAMHLPLRIHFPTLIAIGNPPPPPPALGPNILPLCTLPPPSSYMPLCGHPASRRPLL